MNSKLGTAIAESEYWAQFKAIRGDSVIKSLYRALSEALLAGNKKLYEEINEIIRKELKLNYAKLISDEASDHESDTRGVGSKPASRSYIKDVAPSAIKNFYLRYPNGINSGRGGNKSSVRCKGGKVARGNKGCNRNPNKKQLQRSNKHKK